MFLCEEPESSLSYFHLEIITTLIWPLCYSSPISLCCNLYDPHLHWCLFHEKVESPFPVVSATSFHLWVTPTSGSMTISVCLHGTRLNQHWPNPQGCLLLMGIQALTSQAELQESLLLISMQKAWAAVHRHVVINTGGVLAALFITFIWCDVAVLCATGCLCLHICLLLVGITVSGVIDMLCKIQ